MYKLQITGNIGKDAEIVPINGSNYAVFNVAVSKGKDKTEWIKCYKKDENSKLAPYLLKGVKVFCEGQPSIGAYLDKDKNAVGTLAIFVNDLEFLSKSEKAEKKETTSSEPDDLPFD